MPTYKYKVISEIPSIWYIYIILAVGVSSFPDLVVYCFHSSYSHLLHCKDLVIKIFQSSVLRPLIFLIHQSYLQDAGPSIYFFSWGKYFLKFVPFVLFFHFSCLIYHVSFFMFSFFLWEFFMGWLWFLVVLIMSQIFKFFLFFSITS